MLFEKEIAKLIPLDMSEEEIIALLETPKDSSLGDIALPCFKLSKILRKSPAQIADELKAKIPQSPYIESVESVSGYLNIRYGKKAVFDALGAALSKNFGSSDEGRGKTICIDYSSVNIAKPFHIGHLSTTVIGAALYRIFKYLGYNVVGINHLGDWGTQFGKLISAYKRWGDKEEVEKSGVMELTRLYVKFHKEAEANPELEDEARRYFKDIEDGDSSAKELFNWFKEITLAEVEKIYKRLKVHFDSYNGESFYNDKMEPCLKALEEKGLLVDSDGAKVVMLDEFGMPPCLLVKADGATLYATRDIAAACYRKRTYDFYKCLYVVAYQQNLHFKQFFKVLELMGYSWAKDLEHVAFGMVSLEDGAMSTREGRVVLLKDVLDKAVEKARAIMDEKKTTLENKDDIAESVGVGAVIFSALSQNRIKDIVFSFDKVLNFDGETAPYIQYTNARCRSVLKKGGDCSDGSLTDLKEKEEYDVAMAVLAFPEAVEKAARLREPCMISRSLIDICEKYNRFYIAHSILQSEERVKKARLLLTEAVSNTLKTGLALLGIDAPDSM